MVALGVVSFVEDEQIDFPHGDEGVHYTVEENLGCAYNDHVF